VSPVPPSVLLERLAHAVELPAVEFDDQPGVEPDDVDLSTRWPTAYTPQ
jgi:hypothetical protein